MNHVDEHGKSRRDIHFSDEPSGTHLDRTGYRDSRRIRFDARTGVTQPRGDP